MGFGVQRIRADSFSGGWSFGRVLVGRGFGRRHVVLRRRVEGWSFKLGVQGYALRFGIEDVCHYCQLRECLRPRIEIISPLGVAVAARRRAEKRNCGLLSTTRTARQWSGNCLTGLLRWIGSESVSLGNTRCAYGLLDGGRNSLLKSAQEATLTSLAISDLQRQLRRRRIEGLREGGAAEG